MKFDDYAHLVWVGILILIVSLLLGDWTIVPFLAGFEMVMFAGHVRHKHPDHPFARPTFLLLGIFAACGGAVLAPLMLVKFPVMIGQCIFSDALHVVVHDYEEGRTDRRYRTIPLVAFGCIMSIAAVAYLRFWA